MMNLTFKNINSAFFYLKKKKNHYTQTAYAAGLLEILAISTFKVL